MEWFDFDWEKHLILDVTSEVVTVLSELLIFM